MTYLVISYVEGLQSGILNPRLFPENPASRTSIIAQPEYWRFLSTFRILAQIFSIPFPGR